VSASGSFDAADKRKQVRPGALVVDFTMPLFGSSSAATIRWRTSSRGIVDTDIDGRATARAITPSGLPRYIGSARRLGRERPRVHRAGDTHG